jgi:hypothetical protein
MANLPFPLQGQDLAELLPQILEMFRDLYEVRVGGALIGDVFQVSGDVLQIKLKAGSGLKKTSGQLDFDLAAIVAPAAAVMQSAYTAKGVIMSASAPGTISAVGVGTDDQVLTADAAQTAGLAWTTPAGGATTTVTYVKSVGPTVTGTITIVNGHITAVT